MTQSQNEQRDVDEAAQTNAENCRITIFDANAFNSSAFAATSPACTSIAMFRTPPNRAPTAEKIAASTNDAAPVAHCPICVARFGLGGAVPKMLPCGHSFCAECIFSLCLHKEYYLLESIFCLKCGSPCDARRALNAPVNAILSGESLCKSNDNNDALINNNIDDSSDNNNITVIHLTNQRKSARKGATSRPSAPRSTRPILGTATLSMMTTPRRRVRCRRDLLAEIPPPPTSLPPLATPLQWHGPLESSDRCRVDYGSDSCGTSRQTVSEADSNYERVDETSSERHQDRITPFLTEMEPTIYSDYGSASCRTTATSGVGDFAENDGATRWRAKFARRTRRFEAQLAKARLKARDAYFDVNNEPYDNNNNNIKNICADDDYRAANDSVAATVADYDRYFSTGDETHYRPRNNLEAQLQRHYHQYASVLVAFDDAKRILRREMSATKINDARRASKLTRRLDTLRKSLERCRFYFEERRVAATSASASVDGVCACIETIVALEFVNARHDQVDWRLGALEKLTRGMRALHYGATGNGSTSNSEYQHLRRSLTDASKLLIALLNERTLIETIPLFDLGFAFIFRALKRCTRAVHRGEMSNTTARLTQLWKMAQSAYSEILRVASTHWECADAQRVRLVASTAQMCSLFAEVCDTATVLLCVIEAARARVALNNAAADATNDNALHSAERARAHYHLQRIDEHLMECRRIQKLAELRTRTRLLKKLGETASTTIAATPIIVAKTAASAVVARLTPLSRKRAAVPVAEQSAQPSRSSLSGDSCTALPAPRRRRRSLFSWKRIFPRRIFGNTTTTSVAG